MTPRFVRFAVFVSVFVASGVAAAGKPIPAPSDLDRQKPIVFNAKTADKYLQPGDFLLKIYGGTPRMTGLKAAQALVVGAQKLMKKTSGLFDEAWRKADPSIVHAGIYIGGGKLAEADSGGILQQSLDASKTFRFYVYRYKDVAMRKRATEVAKRWSNGRMGYLPPITVLGSSSFGPKARKEALEFGRAADKVGGPSSFSRMFCIQFMIAAYQAAHVSAALAKNPKLRADDIKLPYSLAVHGTNLTPGRLDGLLRVSTEGKDRAWEYVGLFLAKP